MNGDPRRGPRERRPAARPLSVLPLPPVAEADRLCFSYPDGTTVLRGVSFRIHHGESVALVGPNGAGKSTLLLHLNGILKGTGELRVLGLPVAAKHLRTIRSMVGIVFQDPEDQLFLTTVGRDVAFGPSNLGLGGDEVRARVGEALAAVGMEGSADLTSHHLSLGQKKRVAIATVLAMHPELLVLDEPSANLDPRARRQLIEILRALPATKLVATHDLALALELCERAILLDGGVVAADGSSESILLDEALLMAHGLEVPYGISPAYRGSGAGGCSGTTIHSTI